MNNLFHAMKSDDYGIIFFIIFIGVLIVSYQLYFKNKLSDFFKSHPLLKYSLKRIFMSCLTLFLIVTIVFLTLRMLPKESYVDKSQFVKLSAAEREIVIAETYKFYGFDQPIWNQLYSFYKRILPFPKTVCLNTEIALLEDKKDAITGQIVEKYSSYCTAKKDFVFIDLGRSLIGFTKNQPITQFISQKWRISFIISFISLVVSLTIGWVLGILMAKGKDKWIDKFGQGYYIIVSAIPIIVYFGLIYTILLALKISPIYEKKEILTILPPVIAMSFITIPFEAIWLRRYMVDESSADYIKFARAKGLSETRITFVHIFRNALVPVIRSIPTAILGCISGSYLIETMFNVPGIGKALIASAKIPADNNMVEGLVLFYAIISIISYLLADLVTVLFDPRISLTENK